jgi:hypothetical protein
MDEWICSRNRAQRALTPAFLSFLQLDVWKKFPPERWESGFDFLINYIWSAV